MSLATRLDQLLPSLSVRQRFALILRAQAAGEQPDPEWSRLPTLEQRQEYDRYAALIIAANHAMGAQVHAMAMVLHDLENRAADVELLQAAAQQLAEQEGAATPPRPVRHWRRLKQIETSAFLCSLAADIRRELQERLDQRWQELEALEIVWAEIAANFDGQDPRHPDLRQQTATATEQLRSLLEKTAGKTHRPAKPTEEVIESMRSLVDRAFGHFNLRVTRE